MEKFIIEGGHRLDGEVQISGAKNASLPIIAATIIYPEKYILHNVPKIGDIKTMTNILKFMGAKIKFENSTLIIDTKNIDKPFAPYELVSKMRASFLVTGAIISRFGEAKVSKPGGCAIGPRSIDEHIFGFKSLGIKINEEHGYIIAKVEKSIKDSKIYFNKRSVTATENVILAAVFADGEVQIINGAKEPHVIELINFLNEQGANIHFAGDVIVINGVKKLSPKEWTINPDYIEAGTFMIATAITKGDVLLKNAKWEYSIPEITKLQEIGVNIKKYNDGIRVITNNRIKSCYIETAPYPGFPTDLQPQMTALLSIADGTSVIKETLYENRFTHIPELNRMSAKIEIVDGTAVINGIEKLSGAKVMASDIRCGASLVLAGLTAEGITEISRIYHIDRGYENLETKLTNLGAKIRRINE